MTPAEIIAMVAIFVLTTVSIGLLLRTARLEIELGELRDRLTRDQEVRDDYC
jgi:hypothetical protein